MSIEYQLLKLLNLRLELLHNVNQGTFQGKTDEGHPTADHLFSVRPSNNENGLLLFLSRFSSV